MYPQLTQIQPLTLIHRNRLLPVAGEVNVRPGQKVKATDIVAQASIPSRHYLVDVNRILGARSNEEAEKLISLKPGDVLEKNDIIAETGGSFSRVIRTPGPGKVISIQNRRVLIEVKREQIALQAGMAGEISRVIADRGVTIEAYGALIQGAWGNTKLGSGPLIIDENSLDGELRSAVIGQSLRGKVLVAGHCSSNQLLKLAENIHIGGLILGSLSSNLVSFLMTLSFPVILLSGFGDFGLDELSRQVLTANANQEISINAIKWNRLTGDRPEIYIPLPTETPALNPETAFSVGQKVRVHSGEYAGRIGNLEQLLPGLTMLPSGLRAAAERIRFDQKHGEILPLVNLDVIQ